MCIGGAIIGAIALLGLAIGVDGLTRFVAGGPAMTQNAALAVMLIGAAGALRWRDDGGASRRVLSLLAALGALAIGVVTIAEYAGGIDLRIDRALVSGPEGVHHGRPSPPTAVAATLLAVALLIFDLRPRARARPSEWLILGAGLIALTVLLGYLFDAEVLYRLTRAPQIGMALPSAISVLLMSVGLLLQRPTAGVMRVALSRGPGGVQLRRLALPAVLVPVLLGLGVRFVLHTVGSDEISVVIAVLVTATITAALLVLVITAAPLNRTHEALQSSQAWNRSIVEQAPDGLFVADIAGHYTDVNSAACRMVGYTRDEVLARSITDLIVPSEVARLFETRDRLLEGGSGVSRWTLRRKDGSHLPVEVNAQIFPDGRWQAQVRDIGERVRLESELRAAESAQKFLADLGYALVATIDDRETVQVVAGRVVGQLADVCSIETLEEDGRLRARVVACRDPAKDAACRRLEALQLDSERPYLGSTARKTKRPLLVSHVTSSYLDTFAHGVEHRRILQELDPKSFMAVPLLAHGGVVGSLVFISTTEDRHYTEADLPIAEAVALRAAFAVERASLYRIAQHLIRLRDDVLSIVAHDLRNPLGTILMQVGLLGRHHPETDRKMRMPLEAIERAARRMNRLIQDLLDVARMEGGRLSIKFGLVAGRQAVAEAMHAQEPLAVSASLGIHLDLPPVLPDLWADHDRLLQVFENLIGNAIKFTRAGGHVTVGAAQRDGAVLFWVADTGIGIAAADLPHVFERLWQAEKTQQLGAGLGLPIVKGIVEAHGGHIWVDSAVGKGTTVFFTIPSAPGGEPWLSDAAPHEPTSH